MGEEWRKDWHPEHMNAGRSEARVLIVGSGPAGLEAARGLGKRGYHVTLAEKDRQLGGRVTREARLPGMSEYVRVRDHRVYLLQQMPNVDIFLESELSAEDVVEIGADHVAIATGATWRTELYNGSGYVDIAADGAKVFTPDDIMDGHLPEEGPVIVFDADGYYMGCAVAEQIRSSGLPVTFVTSSDSVAPWAAHTAERWHMRSRLLELGITVITAHAMRRFDGREVELRCGYSDADRTVPAASLVLVSQRRSNDDLYQKLAEREDLPFTLKRIGDCNAPHIIAQAVYAGHRYARELEEAVDIDIPLRHEAVEVGLPETRPEARRVRAL